MHALRRYGIARYGRGVGTKSGNLRKRRKYEAAYLPLAKIAVRHVIVIGKITKIYIGHAHGTRPEKIEAAYSAVEQADERRFAARLVLHIVIYICA